MKSIRSLGAIGSTKRKTIRYAGYTISSQTFVLCVCMCVSRCVYVRCIDINCCRDREHVSTVSLGGYHPTIRLLRARIVESPCSWTKLFSSYPPRPPLPCFPHFSFRSSRVSRRIRFNRLLCQYDITSNSFFSSSFLSSSRSSGSTRSITHPSYW